MIPSRPFSGSRTRRDCDFFQPTIPFPGTYSKLATTSVLFSASHSSGSPVSKLGFCHPPSTRVPPDREARNLDLNHTLAYLAQTAARASIANGFALVLRSVAIRLAVLFALIFSRFLETRHPGAHPRPSSPLSVAIAVAFIVAVAIVLWCTTTRLLINTTESARFNYFRNRDAVYIFSLPIPTGLSLLLYPQKNSVSVTNRRRSCPIHDSKPFPPATIRKTSSLIRSCSSYAFCYDLRETGIYI